MTTFHEEEEGNGAWVHLKSADVTRAKHRKRNVTADILRMLLRRRKKLTAQSDFLTWIKKRKGFALGFSWNSITVASLEKMAL